MINKNILFSSYRSTAKTTLLILFFGLAFIIGWMAFFRQDIIVPIAIGLTTTFSVFVFQTIHYQLLKKYFQTKQQIIFVDQTFITNQSDDNIIEIGDNSFDESIFSDN
ncbi:MAG TPA: hypothetical protein PLH65_02045 [bacterium]|nr:hypothetical protein [bacterium]